MNEREGEKEREKARKSDINYRCNSVRKMCLLHTRALTHTHTHTHTYICIEYEKKD